MPNRQIIRSHWMFCTHCQRVELSIIWPGLIFGIWLCEVRTHSFETTNRKQKVISSAKQNWRIESALDHSRNKKYPKNKRLWWRFSIGIDLKRSDLWKPERRREDITILHSYMIHVSRRGVDAVHYSYKGVVASVVSHWRELDWKRLKMKF